MNETHKQIAYVLCQCIFDGDMALMRRYIKAGVDIDIGDYDQRTALHIAAAEVNLPAVGPLPLQQALALHQCACCQGTEQRLVTLIGRTSLKGLTLGWI